MTSIAIMQPVYMPWLGYFEQMALCDEFILLDTVQYTKGDWRDRNRIRTRDGWMWLTIPTKKGPLAQTLNHTEICYRKDWVRKHLAALEINYRPCPYFEPTYERLAAVLRTRPSMLTDVVVALILELADMLGIHTRISRASDLFMRSENRQMRVIELCQLKDADDYYSGAKGADYIDKALFASHGISVHYQDYQHPAYQQHFGGFESHMSVVDLLMNHGPAARGILLSSPAPTFSQT